MGRIPDDLYALLAHGDDAHRKWLRDTIESFWAVRSPPRVSTAELKAIVAQAFEFSLNSEHITKPPQALLFARAVLSLASLMQSAIEERDRERGERDRFQRLVIEEKKQREALQEEAEALERQLRAIMKE